MHTVEYIPADWLERAAWAAHCGSAMAVYSRPVEIERRHGERETVQSETQVAEARRYEPNPDQI